MATERIREYEAVMILSPEATEDEIVATIERVDGLITGRGGGVDERERWGLKRLAYPIAGFSDGNYVLTKFSLDASGVAELNRSMAASEDIMRFLVTRLAPAKTPDEADDSEDADDADGAEGPDGEGEVTSNDNK